MTWTPEHGWASLIGRWAATAGAGTVLAVGAADGGGSGQADIDPTATRVVEVAPEVRESLRRLLPDAPTGAPPAPGRDREDAEPGTRQGDGARDPDAPAPSDRDAADTDTDTDTGDGDSDSEEDSDSGGRSPEDDAEDDSGDDD